MIYLQFLLTYFSYFYSINFDLKNGFWLYNWLSCYTWLKTLSETVSRLWHWDCATVRSTFLHCDHLQPSVRGTREGVFTLSCVILRWTVTPEGTFQYCCRSSKIRDKNILYPADWILCIFKSGLFFISCPTYKVERRMDLR